MANLLSGLATCAACGGKMHFVSKGVRRPGGQPSDYLACDNSRRLQRCAARSVNYDLALTATLLSLRARTRRLPDLFPSFFNQQAQATLESLRGQIGEVEHSIERLIDVLERQPASTALEQRLAKNEARLHHLRTELERLEAEQKSSHTPLEEQLAAKAALFQFLGMEKGEGATEGSLEDKTALVHSTLRRLIKQVVVSPAGITVEWRSAGEAIEVSFEEVRRRG
jgi:Recombinase zinc beta ribbon domain